jgi:hypothetical protein
VASSSVPRGPVPSGLQLQQNGLLVSYDFRHAGSLDSLGGYFEFNGSAPALDRVGSVSPDGLQIGVRAHRAGTWEGFFAVTHTAYPASSVFHVRMGREAGNVSSATRSGEAVFAVQTGTTKVTGLLNYVLVASSSTGGLTRWEIGYAEGHLADAKTTILQTGTATTQAHVSEDITLRTDGRTSLEVYFAHKLVYSSHQLNMHIQPPFQPYLEVQGLSIAYRSSFQNFWVARDNSVTVSGLHPGEHVALAPAGSSVVRGVASSIGQARLPLPITVARGTGVLTVQSSSGHRRFGPIAYSGGDTYRLASSGS